MYTQSKCSQVSLWLWTHWHSSRTWPSTKIIRFPHAASGKLLLSFEVGYRFERGTYNTNDMGTRLKKNHKEPIRMVTKHVLGYWTRSSRNTHDHICIYMLYPLRADLHGNIGFCGTAMHAPNRIPWICLMPRYSGQRGMTKNLSRAQPATACLKQLRHTRTFWKQMPRLATTIAPSLHLLANPTWIPDSKFRRICEMFMDLGILWRYWV